MLVLMRCVLAFSALAIVWLDPSEPARLVHVTYASLGAYCVYSVAVAFASALSRWPAPHRALHWLDILFYAVLVSLTGGTSSIFFYFFFYSVLVASFGWGAREGIAVTIASFALFMVFGFLFLTGLEAFELNRTLIRTVYLFVFGYAIAHLGGYEIQLKRRLRLLRDIGNVWDSRFGVDQAIGQSLERLRSFYAAQSCLLVLRQPADPPRHLMYQTSAANPAQASIANAILESAAQPLLALPAQVGALYEEPQRSWLRRPRHVAVDLAAQAQSQALARECAALANLLDTAALVTVPYAQRDGASGRLFATSGTRGFSVSDIEFLVQVADSLAAVLENIVLTEEHMARAADDERAAISRDLHDTTIQPYIGLKLALEALAREVGETSPAARRIGELVEMAEMTVHDLRDYAARLRARSPMPGEALAAAVKKHAGRLARFYGIAVEVTSDVPPRLDGQLAAEAFQIVSEGLSNVLRHTSAKTAFVRLRQEDAALLLEIGNESGEPAPPEFMPRSIHERAHALGGRTTVERRPDGYTVVRVALPA